MPKKQNRSVRLFAKLPLRLVAMFAMFALALVPMIASAWGPSRDTFTIEKPATYVTFDSITNNPNYGDERNFSLVRDASLNGTAGGWGDEVTVENGHEYTVRIYVHNNAAANYNLTAENTRVMSNVPSAKAKLAQIDSFITADNATPGKIWDDVILKSSKDFTVSYVKGSATYTNNVNPTPGFTLSDSIVTSAGAQLGYNQMDGKVPGCFQYAGLVTYRVRVQMDQTSNFSMDKKVRVEGTTEWLDSTDAKPGDTLEYSIGFYNTGEATLNNVVVKDTLPAHVSYIPGSTTLKNADHKDGVKVESDDVVKSNGINIGNYGGGAKAYVYFKVKVGANSELEVCGTNTLRNYGIVKTDSGSKEDHADAKVPKTDCGPEQKECKPGIPEGDSRCDDACSHDPNLPANDPRCRPCATNPNVSADDESCLVTGASGTIPATGPGVAIAITAALALIGAGFAYWYTTTHQKKKATKSDKKLVRKDDAKPESSDKPDDFSDIHNH